jgi:2-hydroxychromene-2-carboxylate isomerase
MTRAIEFHFDFVSPCSYLASTQLPVLARQHGDLAQTTEVIALLNRAGLDGVKLLERAGSTDVVARLDAATAAAAERGWFGSPSFIVGGDLFSGNDRLDYVAAALAAQPA